MCMNLSTLQKHAQSLAAKPQPGAPTFPWQRAAPARKCLEIFSVKKCFELETSVGAYSALPQFTENIQNSISSCFYSQVV